MPASSSDQLAINEVIPPSEHAVLHDQDERGSSAEPKEAIAVDEHDYTATQPLAEHRNFGATLGATNPLGSLSEDMPQLASPEAEKREWNESPDRTNISSLPKTSFVDNDDGILIKIEVPPGYSPLTAKPLVLTSAILIIILIFNLACIISMIAVLFRSGQNHAYYTFSPGTQFIVRYIPGIVGTVTTLATRSMYSALGRLEPFIAMADPSSDADANSGYQNRKSTLAHPYPEPQTLESCIRHVAKWSPNHPRYWFWILRGSNSILINFVTSFKATFLFTNSGQSSTNDPIWIITISPISTFVLISLYVVNMAFTLSLLTHLWSRCTGLKWDPVTIADLLALFHESDVLRDFDALEGDPDTMSRQLLGHKEYRIGYWLKGLKGRDRRVVYGIGRETESPPIPYSVKEMKEDERAIASRINKPETGNQPCPSGSHLSFCRCTQKYVSPRNPHSKNSFYSPVAVLFWWILSLISVSACIYALSQGAVENGFKLSNTWWKFPAHIVVNNPFNSSSTIPPTNITFDPSIVRLPLLNITYGGAFGDDPMIDDLFLYVFVFRIIFVYLATLFALGFLQQVDQGHRFSQPFANMASLNASASDSILLNYLWGTPGVVTIDALKNSYWKVAWFSLLNLTSSSFPIFVGSLFTMTNTGSWIVFEVHKASFYLVLLYLILFASTLPFAWPKRHRRLPRFFMSLADLMSLCYASHVLKNPALDISGANVTRRHLEAKLFLQEETYGVGLYTGSDGKRHFGFDTAYWKDSAGNIVEHVQPIREWPVDETKPLRKV